MISICGCSTRTRNTLFFSLILLFFVQLFGMWLEGIYRLSLVKLAPGKELCGVALLLLPLGVFLLKERWERAGLWFAVVMFVASRLVCPLVNPAGQVIVGGGGVAVFLVILAYAFSARYSYLKGDMGQAAGIAVLVSVALRSWGSSIDPSTEGATSLFAWPLIALALRLFWTAGAETAVSPLAETINGPRFTISMLGFFAGMALVCLVFSCPEVVCAWTGYAEPGFSGAASAGCLAFAFAVVLFAAQRMDLPPRWFAGGWNLLLMVALVGGCLLGRPVLPMTAASPAVFVNGDVPFAGFCLQLALVLSPVIIFNVRHIAGLAPCARPRNAVLPILAGSGLLFCLALLPILSNTWGYVPFGPLFRNRFYLAFLTAGLVMLMPWMLRRPVNVLHCPGPGRLPGALAILLAVLAVAGACAHARTAPRPKGVRVLTVLTYNMQQGSHLNGNRNYSRQLGLIRSLNPDIIGLQESDTVRPSGGCVDAVRFFAESLGYYAYYGPGALAGTFGTAILSRYPIRNARTFFTYSDCDEVATAVGEIDVDGKTVAFFSSHPSGSDSVMNAHVNALKSEAGKYEYVIAAGDYNFTPRESYFASLTELLHEERGDDRGPGAKPDDEIDHIFLSRKVHALERHYISPPGSETDHPAHCDVLAIEN